MPQPSKEPCKKEACDIQACLTKNNFIPQRFVLSHLFLYCCLDDFDSYPAYSSQSLLTKTEIPDIFYMNWGLSNSIPCSLNEIKMLVNFAYGRFVLAMYG